MGIGVNVVTHGLVLQGHGYWTDVEVDEVI